MRKKFKAMDTFVDPLRGLKISEIIRGLIKSQGIIAAKMKDSEAEIAAMDELIDAHKDKLNNE